MSHLQSSTLETTFHVEALVSLGTVKNTLSGEGESTISINEPQTNKARNSNPSYHR